MTERLLQFIWQFRYFNANELRLETGESLVILSPGQLNTHQGPDFLWAAIRIGPTVWVGNIELHLVASGWVRHAHGADVHYNNVILHVVWENDLPAERRSGSANRGASGDPPGVSPATRDIPVLVLQQRVPKLMLRKYEGWMMSRAFVPCQAQLANVGDGVWPAWRQKLLEQRFQRKAIFIRDLWGRNRQDWEETGWVLLARNFGIPVNADAFEAIASSLSFRRLIRHRDRPEELEALLLGQAGLLQKDMGDGYFPGLQTLFRHLQIKYRLRPIHEPINCFRMRPGNFPAIRLVQLAGLLRLRSAWFSGIREAASLLELRAMLDPVGGGVTQKRMGQQMKDSILINTFLPLIYANGWLRKEAGCRERALQMLGEIAPEKNAITVIWCRLGLANRHAADSQALLELKTRYCGPRQCLQCAVGRALLGDVPGEEGASQKRDGGSVRVVNEPGG